MADHVVLLGDSIFDNAGYVPGRPAVVDQVRERLPGGWRATLNARDGAVIGDVHGQLDALPEGASHLVLSAGGNDVLRLAPVLQAGAKTVGEAFRLVGGFLGPFEAAYRRLLEAVEARGLPAAVCAIYNVNAPEPAFREAAAAALALFNDRIIHLAREFRLPVVDLRAVCTEPGDYANEIEPSEAGGVKIARAVCEVVVCHDFGRRQSVLWP